MGGLELKRSYSGFKGGGDWKPTLRTTVGRNDVLDFYTHLAFETESNGQHNQNYS